MKKQQLIESIQRSMNTLTPDVYHLVANAPVQKLPFSDGITAQPRLEREATRSKAPSLRLAPVFALLAIMLLSFTVYSQLFTILGSVGLDVNPSIQIDVNRLDRVIDVKPLNIDAIPIIEGIAYKQVKLEHVVRALVGSMYYHGYLHDPQSAILISVESRDAKKARYLEERVVIEVGELVSLDSSQVYSQIIPDDENLMKKSDEFGVSFGTLNLALMAQEKYPEISLESLFELPLANLYEMAHSEPGTYQFDPLQNGDCGGAGKPCKLILPIIMFPENEEDPEVKPTVTPTGVRNHGGQNDDDEFDIEEWWDDLWDDDEWDDDEWDDDEWDDDEWDDD